MEEVDADLELPDELTSALSQALESAQLEPLPDDCQAFGDGGAHEMIRRSEEGQPVTVNAASSSGKQQRQPNAVPPPLDGADSFATMLDRTDRRFSLGDSECVVEVASGVTTESTRIIASVFSDATCSTRLGTISTAEPLARAAGLKATCSCEAHMRKKLKACVCWIRFNKSMEASTASRWDMFKSLALWLAKGASCTREEHHQTSYTLKVAAGMKPRQGDRE